MKARYEKPKTIVVTVSATSIINSSMSYRHYCNEDCRYWHTCRDRLIGMICEDKRYK